MKRPSQQSALRTPINEILGNQTNVRILREMLRHGGELGAPRIAREAGLSAYGARLGLAALVGAGVVASIGEGKVILYRVDETHPLATGLAALFRAEEARVEAVFAAIRDAVADKAVTAAWVYGSFARGEDTLGSDLDIAVVTDTPGEETLERLREQLAADGERLRFSPSVVGLSSADVVRLSGGDPWWDNLAREAITIKGQRPDIVAARIAKGVRNG